MDYSCLPQDSNYRDDDNFSSSDFSSDENEVFLSDTEYEQSSKRVLIGSHEFQNSHEFTFHQMKETDSDENKKQWLVKT